MNKPSHHEGERSQQPTCENCIHTIRKNGEQDMVVCVPHLKDVPGNSSLVCELHSMKSRAQDA